MYHDVSELRNFYYRSHLGRSTQRRVREAVNSLIGDANGQVLVGHGFAAPFLRPFKENFENVLNFMPAEQGVMAWPPNGKNISTLMDDGAWPLKAGVVDLAIIAHSLENSENQPLLLDEIWRVLTPSGRAVIIVPHRGGVWARGEATPFSHGRPYTLGQINRLFALHRFKICATKGALYAPPWSSRLGTRASKLFELATSRKRTTALSGVLVLLVQKDFGGNPSRLRSREPIFALPELIAAGSNSPSKLNGRTK